MAYFRPSVLVYQDLLSSGGVLNSTPDLETCIIGPLTNTLVYVPGSVPSQIKTAAMSTVSTTGTITAASFALTVASVAGFSIGDSLLIIGAGDSGTTLQANIVSITGAVITLDAAAKTTLTSTVPGTVTKTGKIANSAVSNTFVLPGQKPGQVIDATTIKPWLNNAKVETLVSGAEGYFTDNTLSIRTNSALGTWSTGGISAASNTLTLSAGGGAGLVVGDTLLIAGAGAAGATLSATITNIIGDVLTVTPAAGTTVAAAAVTKVIPSNLNSVTNTLRAEAGDTVVYTYTNNNGVVRTTTSAIKKVVTSSGQNGSVVDIDLNDSFHPGLSFVAQGGMTSGSAVLTVVTQPARVITAMSWTSGVTTVTAAAHGFSVGDIVTIAGVTPSGYNGVYSVVSVPTTGTFTYALVTNPGVVTVQGTATYGTNVTGMTAGAKVLVAGAGSNGADLLALVVSNTLQAITLDTAAGTTVAASKVLVFNRSIAVSVRKTYNNQQLASVKPLSGGAAFDTTNAGTLGTVTINAFPEVVYGSVVSADIFFGYTALRTDLSNRVLTITDTLDLQGQLGTVDDSNPLALGVSLALANTTGRIRAIAITSNDLVGYLSALTYAEGERLYSLVPLTQDLSILTSFKVHAEAMSTPENASWRVAIVNTAIPTQQNMGQYSPAFVNANGGNNAVTIIAGKYVLTASNATFISDGVAPGDSVYFTSATPAGQVGAHQVLEVVSNQQLVIQTTSTSTAISYYISRTMSKTQSAAAVASVSSTFNTKRIWHIQPDTVGVTVNGVVKYLPGYYLACGLGGMVAGFPVQQGFTNIGVAGIVDLKNSNFYFSKDNISAMASVGTCVFVQASQGGTPYVLHELTTDITVLEYREMLVVKNWDFLSYYYFDKLKSFIGSWNITPDTLNTIRQTLVASSELMKTKKLPKIGAPLLSYNIKSLAQNAFNKDNLDVTMLISVVYPLNYLNLRLVI